MVLHLTNNATPTGINSLKDLIRQWEDTFHVRSTGLETSTLEHLQAYREYIVTRHRCFLAITSNILDLISFGPPNQELRQTMDRCSTALLTIRNELQVYPGLQNESIEDRFFFTFDILTAQNTVATNLRAWRE